MRFLSPMLLLCLGLLTAGPARLIAQAPLPPADLATCQTEARQNNRGLATARNALRSALAGVRIAESDVYAPSLDVTQTFTDGDDRGEARAEIDWQSPLGIQVTPYLTENNDGSREERWFSNAGINLQRRLFSAQERWRIRAPLTNAERGILTARNNLEQRLRELDFTVMRSFLAVQRVENRLRVRRDRVIDAKEFLKTTKAREKGGLAPRVDIVNAEINLNQAEADVLNEEDNLREQTESLLNLLGRGVAEDLRIDPFPLEDKAAPLFNLEADTTNVLARHESLVNARLDIDFARIEWRIAKDLLRPQIGLSFTAEHRSDGADLLNERVDQADPISLALTYQLPLDGKKADKARLRQLELSIEDLKAGLIDEENTLLIELRGAHRGIARLKTQVGLNQKRLEAERSKLEATLVRYEDGNVDNLEVTRAKQAVDDAEISLINTRIDLVLAEEQYRSLLPPIREVQTTLSAP